MDGRPRLEQQQQQQSPVPTATATTDAQKSARKASQLSDAKLETEAIEAEARGDYVKAKMARIRLEYNPRIRAAMSTGNRELAEELEKQCETKIIEILARERSRRRQ